MLIFYVVSDVVGFSELIDLSDLVDRFFGRNVDAVALFDSDPDAVSKHIVANERMIQFYVVLYGLMLASGGKLASSGGIIFVVFLCLSIAYYILVMRFLGLPDAKKRNGLKSFRKIVNLNACFVSLAFSLSVIYCVPPVLGVKYAVIFFHILILLLFLMLFCFVFLSLSV